MWGGGCGCEEVGVVMGRWVWRDLGACGRWVQMMERVKIEDMERESVRKRVSSHTRIDMLHLLCTL